MQRTIEERILALAGSISMNKANEIKGLLRDLKETAGEGAISASQDAQSAAEPSSASLLERIESLEAARNNESAIIAAHGHEIEALEREVKAGAEQAHDFEERIGWLEAERAKNTGEAHHKSHVAPPNSASAPSPASPAPEIPEWVPSARDIFLEWCNAPGATNVIISNDILAMGDRVRRLIASRAPRPAPQTSVEEMAERMRNEHLRQWGKSPSPSDAKPGEYWLDIARAALSALPASDEKPLTPAQRVKPCGCVVCVCPGDERCYGCGARSCDEHNPSVQRKRLEEHLAAPAAPKPAPVGAVTKCARCGHMKATHSQFPIGCQDRIDDCPGTFCKCEEFVAPKPAREAQGAPTLNECLDAYHAARNAAVDVMNPGTSEGVEAVRSLCLSRAPSPSPALAALVDYAESCAAADHAVGHVGEYESCSRCEGTRVLIDRARAALGGKDA